MKGRTAALRALVALLVLGPLGACGDRIDSPALAASEPPPIRVLLGKPRARATLRISKQAWEAVGTAGRAFSAAGADLDTPLQATAAGIALRGRDTGATEIRIRAAKSFVLDSVAYGGALVVRKEGAALELVNEVDLETYVAGVIPNEMAPGATPATFRAQAVAARTYAWLKLTDPETRSDRYQVFDSDRSQVYRGLTMPPEMLGTLTTEEALQRARETRGVILTWQGRPFRAWYASTCGGHTTDPFTGLLDPTTGVEPLRGVPCRFCGTSKYFTWEKQVGDPELIAAFERDKRPIAAPIHSIDVEPGRGGWVKMVRVVWGPRREEKLVPGPAFRTIAGLRSHRIARVTRVAGGWKFDGGGWGHGVGMCQWGALEMGRRGFGESDILRHYYPGTSFTKVY